MATDTTGSEILDIVRHEAEWKSSRGLRYDIVPWRLYQKAKQLFWDPARIDFSKDREDYEAMDETQRRTIAFFARGFMVGEESVTLDIVPLIVGVADEGRVEEAIYLTTFAMEEAKHVDFFRRWFDAVGEDPQRLYEEGQQRRKEMGVERDPTAGLFESELPRVMRRVLVDRSPKAFLDCGVTYNQFIEGCLAISGYKLWGELFKRWKVLPGLQHGLSLVRRDEGRHITYGTYLCRRILQESPELMEFGKARMYELADQFFGQFRFPKEAVSSLFDESGRFLTDKAQPFADAFNVDIGEIEFISSFIKNGYDQVERRIQVMEKALQLSDEEAFLGEGSEAAEIELETVEA
ncbi:MAG: R2-like ligand-binding oxidase [Acidimicrobiia bacterium]